MRPEYIKDAIRRVIGPNQRPASAGNNSQVPVASPPNLEPHRSAGLGDTIEKLAHKSGLDNLAKAYTKVTGKDCGCNKRKEALNKAFPYQ